MGTAAEHWPAGAWLSLQQVLKEREVAVSAPTELASALPMATAVDEVPDLVAGSELVVVAGGDGRMLSLAWPLARDGVPVTGINFGRLGFLADISPKRIGEELPLILDGKGVVDDRLLLRAAPEAPQPPPQQWRALNEVLVHAPEVAHLVEFEVFVDDDLLYRIRADGIIVATPTGSTAYALSAGGSIFAPGLAGLAVVPMLAQGPGSGSIVLPADSRLRILSPSETRLTLDGQTRLDLPPGQPVLIEREEKKLRLLHPTGQDFFARIRDKLGWGLTSVAYPPAVDQED